MEKILIDHSQEYIHLNLGISDERATELEELIKKNVLVHAVENNIVTIDEDNGEVSLSASAVMDFLLNNLAQTEQERLFLMMHVDSLTTLLDQYIRQMGNGFLSAEEE